MSNVLHGITGSPGIRLGTIFHLQLPTQPANIAVSDPHQALAYFTRVQAQVAAQLERVGAELRAEGKAPEAAIFEAQAMLVLDPMFAAEVERHLQQPNISLEAAIIRATQEQVQQLRSLDDEYLRARADDVRAVGEQILAVMSGAPVDREIPSGAIIVAPDLTPAQIAILRKRSIAGIATAGGTATGHVAILARALGFPAVIGLGEEILHMPEGAAAILDADAGRLIVGPTKKELNGYDFQRKAQRHVDKWRQSLANFPTLTTDGHRVNLWANIGHPEEAHLAIEHGAEGVGLFRTEFLFLDRTAAPTEEEQYSAYVEVLRQLKGRPVMIRTLDVGGDKALPYLPQIQEANPFLGTRGIRFGMRFPELFQAQLRALLRAATEGDVRIMLPMIATPADVLWARTQLAAAAAALHQTNQPYRPDVPLGIMVETPAAAVSLDLLTQGISFGSIGSNDLAQYTLAADRSNGTLARQYHHSDPAVFRLIRIVARTAQRLRLDLSICGELAADPETSVILFGLGIQKLSITPTAMLAVKEAIRGTSFAEAQRKANLLCDQGVGR